MDVQVKDPSEVFDYTFDWSVSGLASGDTISTSTWIVPSGLTEVTDTNTATMATVWLSGGSDGGKYIVENTIVTADGRTHTQQFVLLVKDESSLGSGGITPYATLEDVIGVDISSAGEFTIPDGYADDDVYEILQRASQLVDAVTGDHWSTQSLSFILSGRGTPTLQLTTRTRLRCVSISSIYFREDYNSADNFSSAGELVDADDYRLSPSHRAVVKVEPTTIRGGRTGLPPVWLSGHDNYKITGTFGHQTTPKAIKWATALLVREWISPGELDKRSRPSSEKFPDGYQYTLPMGSARNTHIPDYTGVRAVDYLLHPYVNRIPLMVAT